MLKVAFIGFGYSVKRFHLPYLEKRKNNIEVKYIYRRKEDVEKEGRQEEFWYPDITFTTDIDDIMNDDSVNLVVINTPDDYHVQYSMMALEHGKNILCEKPFANTEAEAKEVFEFAKSKGLIAMANQNRRYDADMRTLRKVLNSNVLGDIVEVESHYDYYNPKMAHFKKFMFLKGLGVHPIDQMIGEFGIPKKCVYDCRSIDYPGEADSYYDIDLFYENGMKVIVKTCFYVTLDYPRFIVHGKKGSFLMPALGHQSSQEQKEGPIEISFDPLPEETWGTIAYVDEYGNEIKEKVPTEVGDYGLVYDNILDILEKGAEKVIKDEEVCTVLHIIEEAMKVAKEVK